MTSATTEIALPPALSMEAETLDVALVPQPGTVAAEAEAGTIVSLVDVGGERTMAFGPMKPVGLTDPRTGRRRRG